LKDERIQADASLSPPECFGGPPLRTVSRIIETRVDGALTSVEVVLNNDWNGGPPFLDDDMRISFPAKALPFAQWLMAAWDNRRTKA